MWRFVEEFSKAFAKPIDAIARENMAALQRYAWPGNIRELRNVVERAMIVAQGPRLTIPLPAPAAARGEAHRSLERHREGSHSRRAREHVMAHPGSQRRGGAARSPADHPRNAHRQAWTQTAETVGVSVADAHELAGVAIDEVIGAAGSDRQFAPDLGHVVDPARGRDEVELHLWLFQGGFHHRQ